MKCTPKVRQKTFGVTSECLRQPFLLFVLNDYFRSDLPVNLLLTIIQFLNGLKHRNCSQRMISIVLKYILNRIRDSLLDIVFYWSEFFLFSLTSSLFLYRGNKMVLIKSE